VQSLITAVLQFFWSFGQGSDGQVLANRGGTQMAATSQFIGSLIDQSFSTFSTLIGMTESSQELFGTCRRVSDVLLVIEELESDRLADAKRVEATEEQHTPRRGERLALTSGEPTSNLPLRLCVFRSCLTDGVCVLQRLCVLRMVEACSRNG